MSTDVTDQLAGWLRAAEGERGPITVDELLDASVEPTEIGQPIAIDSPNGRRARTVVFATAAAVALVVAGFVVLASAPEAETPVVTTPPTLAPASPTTVPDDDPETADADTLPIAGGLVVEPADLPRVVEGLEPFGTPVVTHREGPSEFWPHGLEASRDAGMGCVGGVVETPTGYAALGSTSPYQLRERALATSTDGLDWSIVDSSPVSGFGDACARLFEAGGWYWIGVNESVIYRSADALTWETIDLDGSVASPMGATLADQRWHEFGGRLVAPTSGGLVSVDMATGQVETHPRPWGLPPGGGFWWMTTIDGELTAFVSVIPYELEAADETSLLSVQYSTADLESWTGPSTPVLASGDGAALYVTGDVDRGLLAYQVTGPTETGWILERRYVSGDGFEWRRLRLVGEYSSEAGSVYGIGIHPVVPVRIAGRQGVAQLDVDEPLLHLSVDGLDWQQIELHDDHPLIDINRGLDVSDNTIFYYEVRGADDGSPLLATWRITFEP